MRCWVRRTKCVVPRTLTFSLKTMNQIYAAAKAGLTTCPKTSWAATPIYDHNYQRLSVDSMVAQLYDQSDKAYAKVLVMLVEWGLTGKWPPFRNDAVYFVREILTWWTAHTDFQPLDDFPAELPPWKSKYVAVFLKHALWWYSMERKKWAYSIAEDAFSIQEHDHNARYPME